MTKRNFKVPTTAIYATGKRKASIARLWLWERGAEDREIFEVNGSPAVDYFCRKMATVAAFETPFKVVENDKYNIYCTITGGGYSGQSGALRHAISKALSTLDGSMRPSLKAAGLLTRDSRVVERKKYGQSGARKRYQFSKR